MMQGEVQYLQPTDSQNLSGSATCRICLMENVDSSGDELISPCMCKGTQKFVHRSCLDQWRSVKGGFVFSNCTTCNAQFHLPPFDDDDNGISAREKFLIFLILQPFIAMLAGLVYMLDKYVGNFRNSLKNEQVIGILAKHPIPFYYSIGFVIFFGWIGFFTLLLELVYLFSQRQ